MPETNGVTRAYFPGQYRFGHRMVQMNEVLREIKPPDGEPQARRPRPAGGTRPAGIRARRGYRADRGQRARDRAQQPAHLVKLLPADDAQPADGIVAGPVRHRVPGGQVPRIAEEEYGPGVTAEPGIRLIGRQRGGELYRAIGDGLRIEFTQHHGHRHVGHFLAGSVQAPPGPLMAAVKLRLQYAL